MFAVERDLWLTQKMGYHAFRLDAGPPDGSATLLQTSHQLAAATQVPGFYYVKIAATDLALCCQLEDCGFRLVDTNITLEVRTEEINAGLPGAARLARAEDRDAVVHVARSAFTQSRFHLDPRISIGLANDIKAAWAANYFEGKRGQFMVVAELDGVVRGFMQLLAQPNASLTIDLIGVEKIARGRGLGRAMVACAQVECATYAHMRVGTQAANVQSLRFYETLGFRVAASAYVLHLHRPD